MAVAVGGPDTALLLRRAFALYGAGPDGAGTIQFVVAEHGPGTRWLAQRNGGTQLDLVGPLGDAVPLPRADVRSCWLAAAMARRR